LKQKVIRLQGCLRGAFVLNRVFVHRIRQEQALDFLGTHWHAVKTLTWSWLWVLLIQKYFNFVKNLVFY
jgi:hypothetical protein